MTSLHPKTTGLGVNIWIFPKITKSHGPRIKVQQNYERRLDLDHLFSLSISDTPRIAGGTQGELTDETLKKIFEFIILNKTALLEFWKNEDWSSVEMIKGIVKN